MRVVFARCVRVRMGHAGRRRAMLCAVVQRNHVDVGNSADSWAPGEFFWLAVPACFLPLSLQGFTHKTHFAENQKT